MALNMQRHIPCLCGGQQYIDRLFNQSMQVDVFRRTLTRGCFNLREGEQIIDQSVHTLRLRLHNAQEPLLGLWIIFGNGAQCFDKPHQCGQRAFQFMGHIGHEIPPHLLDLFLITAILKCDQTILTCDIDAGGIIKRITPIFRNGDTCILTLTRFDRAFDGLDHCWLAKHRIKMPSFNPVAQKHLGLGIGTEDAFKIPHGNGDTGVWQPRYNRNDLFVFHLVPLSCCARLIQRDHSFMTLGAIDRGNGVRFPDSEAHFFPALRFAPLPTLLQRARVSQEPWTHLGFPYFR